MASGEELAGRMRTIEEIYPPYRLRITCGPLELRHVREADVPDVVELAQAGIYDPSALPFLNRWAEAPADRLPLQTAQFYWGTMASFSPAAWDLRLVVRHEGVLVGMQDLSTNGFVHTGSIETGSWLGRDFQGRGIGTLMRQAVCAFGFDHLHALQMTSGYMEGNEASEAVSRKVGYTFNGRFRSVHPDGDSARVEERVLLTPENFVRPPYPVEVAGGEQFRAFIGLPPAN